MNRYAIAALFTLLLVGCGSQETLPVPPAEESPAATPAAPAAPTGWGANLQAAIQNCTFFGGYSVNFCTCYWTAAQRYTYDDFVLNQSKYQYELYTDGTYQGCLAAQ